MKTASNLMEHAVQQTPSAPRLLVNRTLPTTSQEISRYVDLLLTADEQVACDRATD